MIYSRKIKWKLLLSITGNVYQKNLFRTGTKASPGIEQRKTEKRCYTVQELQEILGVSRPTIYNLLKKKEFRWIQLDGGKYRISKKSFDDWLDNLEQ